MFSFFFSNKCYYPDYEAYWYASEKTEEIKKPK